MEQDLSNYIQNETKQNINGAVANMTALERSIAQYFLKNTKHDDFSSKNISRMLYVSEPSLSRFAKKCGYKGYREFIFSYSKDLDTDRISSDSEKNISVYTRKIEGCYQNLLTESFRLMNEDQLRSIARLLTFCNKTFVYGIGNSGYVAREFQLRFMRIGLDVEAFTDSQMMKMSAALAREDTLIIAISLSGTTKEIIDSIRIGAEKKAKVVLITSYANPEIESFCTEIITVPSFKNLDSGTKISPQFPLLIVIDILYSYYFGNDSFFKTQKYNDTLSAISDKKQDDKQ